MTALLSPTEREDFRQLFEKRLQKVQVKTADVFAFKKVEQPRRDPRLDRRKVLDCLQGYFEKQRAA